MEQKTISINPNLFNISSSNNSSPKNKKDLSLKIQKPTNIKRELIKKIRNYQNKTKKRKSYPLNDEFTSEFKDSIDYLRNVMNEKKIANNENINQYVKNSNDHLDTTPNVPYKPLQNTPNNIDVNNYNLQNTEKISPQQEVPWGNMKNGNKPTYRTWVKNQTLKNPKPVDHVKTQQYIESENLSEPIFTKESIIQKDKPNKKIKKKTIKKKYTCGKSKTKKQIAIIIKGIETKNKVLKEQRDLRKESIQSIKNYLYRKSFIKVGSTAPDKVLRDMYESIILTGNVNNKNSHILIHNYMNENNNYS